MSIVVEFTRTTNVFKTLTIEGDALTALLDEHCIGESGESLDERMWTANAFSTANAAFWTAVDALVATEDDHEDNFTLDEVTDEDAEDDEDDEDDDSDDVPEHEDLSDTLDYAAELLAL